MLRKGNPNSIRCGNQLVDLSTPVIMGIINVTPDSFYKPSRVAGSLDLAVEMAAEMIAQGAVFLDVGGMSTRPGSQEIPVEAELERVLPVIEKLHDLFPDTVISVDTYRAEVARHCIAAGATMVNDVSGGQLDQELLSEVASHQVAYVLMHMRGTPATMNQNTEYQDITNNILKYFVKGLRDLKQKGIREIILDPGFGFAKTMEQNYKLIDQLGVFRILECPLMVGISRKSTLANTIGRPVEETLEATTALHMVALQNGASILRAHDVRAANDAIAVYKRLLLTDV